MNTFNRNRILSDTFFYLFYVRQLGSTCLHLNSLHPKWHLKTQRKQTSTSTGIRTLNKKKETTNPNREVFTLFRPLHRRYSWFIEHHLIWWLPRVFSGYWYLWQFKKKQNSNNILISLFSIYFIPQIKHIHTLTCFTESLHKDIHKDKVFNALFRCRECFSSVHWITHFSWNEQTTLHSTDKV